MKKFYPIFTVKVVVFLLVVTMIMFFFKKNHEKISEKIAFIENDEKNDETGKDMYDEAAASQQLEIEKTKDPALGYVPKERLMSAFQYAELSKQIAMRSRSTVATWVERGPTADVVGGSNDNTRNGVAPVASGRMKALWVDRSDASGNTVWAGGIGGGLWKTTNFKTSPASWIPVNDFFTNMSIGSICQDPTNNNTMYFGTGERTYNKDAIRGNGVWKSTDHGVNWTLLAATSNYMNVSKVLCDASGNLYVGVIQNNLSGGTSGFFRSTNGGTSFTSISPNGIDPRVSDFVISSTGRLHICTGYYNSATPGYRYTNSPSTVTSASGWTTAAASFPVTSTTNINCVLACKGDTLYALPCDNTSNVTTVYKSIDGGANWAATATSPSNGGLTGFCSSQGWYCLAIDVNPTNANNVIIGSLNCYATTDGGSSWTRVSDWVTGSTGQYVHADIQIIKWNTNNDILVGNDGGIFYSPNGGSIFQDRNTGLNIKQFYSCDYHPTLTNYFLAGSQDNGCHQFTTTGLNTTTEVTGGDGSYVHIDKQNPMNQICSYTYNKYRLSTDGGSTWTQYNLSVAGKLINPTDYDNTNKLLYACNGANSYSRWDPINTPGTLTSVALASLNANMASAVTVSPHINNRVYFGTDLSGGASRVIKCDNANATPTATDITGTLPSLYVSCIAVGPNVSDNDLIVTYSSYDASLRHIFYSTNGGTTWTNISGNLPDMPVRWAVFDPASNTKAWIATETGIWSTTAINGASTVWAASPGFPTVRTDMVKYRSVDQILVAATHGRGLWTQSLAIVLPINNFLLRGKWKSTSTVELSWDYSNNAGASFEIESSSNGTYFIKASASQTNTNYLDQPSTADIYYRVKGKNIFGNVSYSNVIHLQKHTEIKDITAVRIFPNPVKDNMKIAFASSGNGVAHYQVTSSNGQVCWKKDEDISATGEYIREWNMQSLKPGTYVFTIVYNNKKITQKFSKQ